MYCHVKYILRANHVTDQCIVRNIENKNTKMNTRWLVTHLVNFDYYNMWQRNSTL